MSPPGVGEAPPEDEMMATGGGFIGPEHIAQLQGLANKVHEKVGEFNTNKFTESNRLESSKGEAIRSFLLMMQEAGVDVSDQAAVAAFIDHLRSIYPELGDLFEFFVEQLLGDVTEADADGVTSEFSALPGVSGEEELEDEEDMDEEEDVEEGPMSKYENLSQDVREHI
jgi:hypothetical protein